MSSWVDFIIYFNISASPLCEWITVSCPIEAKRGPVACLIQENASENDGCYFWAESLSHHVLSPLLFSFCPHRSCILEMPSCSLGYRVTSQNQMWSSLPSEGTVYPLIFNVVIHTISFSYGILLFFFCFPLCLLFLFFSFMPSFWLCCGSSWFSHILTKSVDDFVLAGGELGQTQTLNSVLPVKDRSSDFSFLLLAVLQAILSLPHAYIVQSSETWAKFMQRIWGSFALALSFLGFPPHSPAPEPLVLQARKTADFLVKLNLGHLCCDCSLLSDEAIKRGDSCSDGVSSKFWLLSKSACFGHSPRSCFFMYLVQASALLSVGRAVNQEPTLPSWRQNSLKPVLR